MFLYRLQKGELRVKMASPEERERDPEVSDQFLQNLAGELTDEWLDLARHLKISEGILHNKKTDNMGDVKEAKYQMLLCWKRKEGQRATYSVLGHALVRAGRRDLKLKMPADSEELYTNERSRIIEFPSGQASYYSTRQLPTTEYSIHRSGVGDRVTTSALKEKKRKLKEQLRKKYKNLCGTIRPIPFLRKIYSIDDVFVQSKIVYFDGTQRESELQEKWEPLKNYEDIFTDDRIKSRLRIIDGEPGYGKSTLTLKIAHDWCHEKPPLVDFEILILLRLRQFKNEKSIYSGIRKFLLPKDSTLKDKDIKRIIDSSSTLIILDGYDEYPDRKEEETDIDCIIRGDMFQEKGVILTARTACVPLHCPPSTARIRLTGFGCEAQDGYIEKLYGELDRDQFHAMARLLYDSPIDKDLMQVPLFFVTIFGMIGRSHAIEKLHTSTKFFRQYVACFHSHEELRGSDSRRKGERTVTDHSKLDEEAFEGLSSNLQRITWDRDELRSKIGDNLYQEYTSVGILIEEDVFNDDDIDYRTQTRFFHKLFVEWFAACHLAKKIENSGAKDEACYQERDNMQAATGNNTSILERLDPSDFQYVFRFACGLSRDSGAGPIIIEYLGTDKDYDYLTLSCIGEWGGNLKDISNTVGLLASRGICISRLDKSLVKAVSVEVLKHASNNKIEVQRLELSNCVNEDQFNSTQDLPLYGIDPRNGLELSLPVITSLKKLVIAGGNNMTTTQGSQKIFQYSSMCPGLTELCFTECMLPRSVNLTASLCTLKSRSVTVMWTPKGRRYFLNLDSGHWESTHFRPIREKDEKYLWELYRRMELNEDYIFESWPKGTIIEDPLWEFRCRLLIDSDGTLRLERQQRLSRHIFFPMQHRYRSLGGEGPGMEILSRIAQMQWARIQREMTDAEYYMEERELEDRCTKCLRMCVIL